MNSKLMLPATWAVLAIMLTAIMLASSTSGVAFAWGQWEDCPPGIEDHSHHGGC